MMRFVNQIETPSYFTGHICILVPPSVDQSNRIERTQLLHVAEFEAIGILRHSTAHLAVEAGHHTLNPLAVAHLDHTHIVAYHRTAEAGSPVKETVLHAEVLRIPLAAATQVVPAADRRWVAAAMAFLDRKALSLDSD